MNITDAHLHLWDLSRVTYNWLAAAEGSILCRTHGPEDLQPQLSSAGVSRAVLVQSANSLEDTGYMFEMSRQHDWISGVVAWLPLTDPVWSHRLLETYREEPFFKGIRHLMHIEPDDRWLRSPQIQESLRMLADSGIPLDGISINDRQFDAILETAADIPSLKIVLDHLGQPPIAESPAYTGWAERMRRAAALPKVHVKVSGLGTMPRDPERSMEDRFGEIISEVIAWFGTDRVMFGGDWPVSRLDREYAHTWDALRSILKNVSADDQEKMLDRNAAEFYNL